MNFFLLDVFEPKKLDPSFGLVIFLQNREIEMETQKA